MATKSKNARELQSFTFNAKALAAHFRFTKDDDDFGPEFAVAFHGRAPFKHKERTGGHRHPEISFTHSWLHVHGRTERGGAYVTIAKSGLRNLNVKGKITADEIEAGLMAVYREEWYGDPARPERPRILPLPPVLKNLKVCGKPYRLGKELRLPEAFELSEARRKEYFAGEVPEIEPVEVSQTPGKPQPSECGEIAISTDTRRIEIPNFGIVTFADWKWLPREIHTHAQTTQLLQLIGLELKNPGSGGGGGVIIGGSPSGK